METSKTREKKVAYLLNEKKLKELQNILNPLSEDLVYEVSCIEGTTIKFTSLDEFLRYPNRKTKQYKRIEIRTPYSITETVSIIFSNNPYQSITYRVSGEEDKVDSYSVKIEDFLVSLKRWYSMLSTNAFVSISMGSIFLVVLMNSMLSTFHSLRSINPFIAAVFAIPCFYIYDKTRLFLFPVASFELGDGVERVRLKDNIRNTVLVGVFLAAIVGFLVNQLPPINK